MFYLQFYYASPNVKNLSFNSLYSTMSYIESVYNSDLWFDYVNITYKDEHSNVVFKFTLTKEILDLTQDYNELLITINRIFAKNINIYIKKGVL